MAEDRNFTLKIVTPERVFFEGQAVFVEFNTTEGEIGIYKDHIPLTVIISSGMLAITAADEVKHAALHSGFAEILQDRITIMAEVVEWPDEIDEKRAERALQRAEDRIKRHEPNTDMARAQTALHRAITRIETLRS